MLVCRIPCNLIFLVSLEKEGTHQSRGFILHTLKTMAATGNSSFYSMSNFPGKISSFYRGLTINVVGSVPYEGTLISSSIVTTLGMLFMSYNAIKSWWPQQERGIGVLLTAGLVAGRVFRKLDI